MNKNIIIGIVMAILVFVSGCIDTGDVVLEEETPEQVEEVRPFIFKTSPWKPYSFEEDGEYKGIDVDMIDLVMTRLGVDYDFEIIPWPRALRLAELGEVDALSTGAYSDDRALFTAFTPEQIARGVEGIPPVHYLSRVDGAFMVRRVTRDSFVYESIEQLEADRYRVGMNQGYSYTDDINKADWNWVSHITEEESMEALANGEIDMYLTYKNVGLAIRDDMGLQDEITVAKGPRPFEVYVYFLFSKKSSYPNWQDLQRRIDDELLKIHESGEYEEIVGKYIQE